MGSSIDFGHDFGPILVDFERILNGFWKDFGRISGRFLEGSESHRLWRNMREAFQVAGLTLMIRATRGRSMDGWMDGWMDR